MWVVEGRIWEGDGLKFARSVGERGKNSEREKGVEKEGRGWSILEGNGSWRGRCTVQGKVSWG